MMTTINFRIPPGVIDDKVCTPDASASTRRVLDVILQNGLANASITHHAKLPR